LGVVNAARVSLHKKSQLSYECINRGHIDTNTIYPCPQCREILGDKDVKLIHYLAQHNHWTPFAHSRLYFDIYWPDDATQLYFYKHANLAGFSFLHYGHRSVIRGSLYGWLHNAIYFREPVRDYIYDCIAQTYPNVMDAFVLDVPTPTFTSQHRALCETEEFVASQAEAYPEHNTLVCATLLIKVPIFVARQIRTSQVGFACSDVYVENESFVFNEVSRRYVNEQPQFYNIEQWYVREGSNVKQGTTNIANEETQILADIWQKDTLEDAVRRYSLSKLYNVAPEQARVLLPQSMYTEFYMTGSLHRWKQFVSLRSQPDVQRETRQMAQRIGAVLHEQYPWVYMALAEA